MNPIRNYTKVYVTGVFNGIHSVEYFPLPQEKTNNNFRRVI